MGKYGRITVEGKDIPEDEPLFLIRAQDVTAPDAIRAYAKLLFGVMFWSRDPEYPLVESQAISNRLNAYADEVAAWQAAHPDRVKVPD